MNTAAILVCLFTCVVTQETDPCGSVECQLPGYECRLVRVSCADDVPCPPQPSCVSNEARISSCDFGLPVLHQTGQQTYSTSYCRLSSYDCPDSTECQPRAGSPSPVCCWTPFPVKRPNTSKPTTTTIHPNQGVAWNPWGQVPGYCAKAFPLPALFCQWLVPECTRDTECLPGSKCCYTEKCGRKGCLFARLQPECSFLDKILGLCKQK